MDKPLDPRSKDRLLRFVILDEDDLSVMSAHLQDARLDLSDTVFLPGSSRFALLVSRIDWQSLAAGLQERRQTGFHFDHVTRVQRSGFSQDDGSVNLQLLTIAFRATSAPAGEVLLTFAGGNMIKLDVACLEAEMRDLSDVWLVKDCPKHRLDDARADR